MEFNKEHDIEIQSRISEFYLKNALRENEVIPDIIMFAKSMIKEFEIEVLQIPLKDAEIGALYHEVNGKKYILLNTSLNQSNNNFAMAHELFHVFFHTENGNGETERYIEQYQDNEEDLMANAFAGNILMPRQAFIDYYLRLNELAEKQNIVGIDAELTKKLTTVVLLMLNFKTTYMSVVVRLYELNLLSQNDKRTMKMLAQEIGENNLRECIHEISELRCYVDRLFYPAQINDFSELYSKAKEMSECCMAAELMDKSYVEYNLSHMEALYKKIASVRK